MITNFLYNNVLISPSQHANNLYIVSGYASPEFALQHINELPQYVSIHLIIGMAVRDGISMHSLNAFRDLENKYPNRFKCYFVKSKPTHSKAYAWFNSINPICGFVGSANYSMHAFSGSQNEILESSDAINIYNYFLELYNNSISCSDDSILNYIPIANRKERYTSLTRTLSTSLDNTTEGNINDSTESITLTLLEQRAYRVPQSSGINWGQREHRNPDQAYIAIPSSIYRTNFFPAPQTPFTLITDDGFQFSCVRAQENGKAIETCYDNSELGKYLRYRLSVPYGQAVVMSDFERYGRSNVTITKISDSKYYLDFSI